MTIKLKAGQVVNVYQKPVTEEEFEGKAILVSEYRPDAGDGLVMWVVNFLKDYPDETYTRTINLNGQQFQDQKIEEFVKVINPVKGKTWGGRGFNVFVEIKFQDDELTLHGVEGPLSSGNCLGSCGQIKDAFMEANGWIKEGYTYKEGWNKELLMGLRVAWDGYHLNSLNAGCEHQREAGYTYKENEGHVCPVCDYKIGTAWKYKAVPREILEFLQGLPDATLDPAWV